MKELLTYIVKNLVSEPDAIAITEEIDGDNVTYSLRVAPGDMGRVIGKQGRMLQQIGQNARFEIENLLDTKVNLQLWVKVKKDWRDSDFLIKNFGYDKNDY